MIHVRVPDELKDTLEKTAKANGRSMNAEIVQRLEQSFHSSQEGMSFSPPIPDSVLQSVTKNLQDFLQGQISSATEKVMRDIENKRMSKEAADLIGAALQEPEKLTPEQVRKLGQQALSMVKPDRAGA